MIQKGEKTCPRCGSPSLKSWSELDEEQQMLARRLPASTEYALSARKKAPLLHAVLVRR